MLVVRNIIVIFTKKRHVKNWQCCLKRRSRDAIKFHVLPLASAWSRTVDFNILFIIYTC